MFDHDAAQFTAPIPGQSLTTEPQGRPWETPAKYSDPEDALTYYVSKIGTADRTAHMLEVLESGLPAAKLVDSITLAGVMEGLHSIDTAIIISPSLFDLITAVADNAGIEYKKGLTSEDDGSPDSFMIERAFKEPEAEEIREEFNEEELDRLTDAIDKTSGGLMAKKVNEEDM
tara:strand:+ start:56 stop:574 length:519 start_codon:yes stop_codon:yes gene_type:complete